VNYELITIVEDNMLHICAAVKEKNKS
jgi:hypothetical protein